MCLFDRIFSFMKSHLHLLGWTPFQLCWFPSFQHNKEGHNVTMDSKTDENQKKWSGSILSAYWKPIGSILNFQKFKIKNLKKLGFILRIVVKFKNLLYYVLKKLRKVRWVLKSKKPFWLVPFNPRAQWSYPLPPPPLPHLCTPLVTHGEVFLNLWSSSLAVNFWCKSIGKSTFRTGFRFDSISFR
jgi:hypothetical protein